jgi:hypothetical protein
MALGSKPVRDHLATFDSLPGQPSAIWELLMWLTEDHESPLLVAEEIARSAVGREKGPVAVVMRAVIANELQRRIRIESWSAAHLALDSPERSQSAMESMEVLRQRLVLIASEND